MSVRATSKRKIDVPLEPRKIRECVMLSVIEHGAYVFHGHVNCLSLGNNCGEESDDDQNKGELLYGSVMFAGHVFSGSTIISDCKGLG